MTNEQKKRWLNRYKDAKNIAKQLKVEALQASELSTSVTQAITGVPSTKAESTSKVELAVERAELAAERYIEAEARAQAIKQEIEQHIDTCIQDSITNLVMKYIYINLLTWEQTAERITVKNGADGCSLNTVWRKHGEGLEKINI